MHGLKQYLKYNKHFKTLSISNPSFHLDTANKSAYRKSFYFLPSKLYNLQTKTFTKLRKVINLHFNKCYQSKKL